MMWQFQQDHRISRAEGHATKAANKVDRCMAEVAGLRKSVDRLTIACQAMWELLRGNAGFTEEILEAKIQEIDLRDGTKDGRISRKPIDCLSCGAKSNSKREHCLMCGAALARPHRFEV